jgi:hypothetical protein
MDVGEDVDGLRDVLAEALGVVDRLLMRGVHTEVSAEIFHLDGSDSQPPLKVICSRRWDSTHLG